MVELAKMAFSFCVDCSKAPSAGFFATPDEMEVYCDAMRRESDNLPWRHAGASDFARGDAHSKLQAKTHRLPLRCEAQQRSPGPEASSTTAENSITNTDTLKRDKNYADNS